MNNIHIYPNTSTIVSDTFLNAKNLILYQFEKKKSVVVISHEGCSKSTIYNFAFAISMRGIFGSVIDMVRYARSNQISRYVHVRSCSEFADRNYLVPIPEFRIYAMSKYIAYFFAKLVCFFYKIEFNYIVLPLVLTDHSSWLKIIPSALTELSESDNFFARVLKQCELHTLNKIQLSDSIFLGDKYLGGCVYETVYIDADALKSLKDKYIFLTLKNIIKFTPLNFLLSILVKLKLIPRWSLFYREAFYRVNFKE